MTGWGPWSGAAQRGQCQPVGVTGWRRSSPKRPRCHRDCHDGVAGGGVGLLAREALLRRRIGSAVLFAVVAAFIASEVWPGSPASSATWVNRVDLVTMVLVLVALALLTRRFFGPVDDSRIAKILCCGAYVAFLALIPARATIELFFLQQPHGGVAVLLHGVIAPGNHQKGGPWVHEIMFLLLMTLYAAAILWMTSRRSASYPGHTRHRYGRGPILGVVMYVVAPLGLSQAATDPWLPGSDVDSLVVLAWILAFCGPPAAAVIADRRYTASIGSPPHGDRARQVVAAVLLANSVGALFVTTLGTSTIAPTLKAAWLRNWLDHGPHLFFGVEGLRPVLGGDPGLITYAHEITAAKDADAFGALCLLFLLIVRGVTAVGASAMSVPAVHGGTEPGDPCSNTAVARQGPNSCQIGRKALSRRPQQVKT